MQPKALATTAVYDVHAEKGVGYPVDLTDVHGSENLKCTVIRCAHAPGSDELSISLTTVDVQQYRLHSCLRESNRTREI